MSNQPETPSDFKTPTGRPSKVHHGDYSAYNYYKCRCILCTKANRDRQLNERRAAGITPKVPATHGTWGMYTNHRCRCVACRAANTAGMRAYQKRRKFNAALAAQS